VFDPEWNLPGTGSPETSGNGALAPQTDHRRSSLGPVPPLCGLAPSKTHPERGRGGQIGANPGTARKIPRAAAALNVGRPPTARPNCGGSPPGFPPGPPPCPSDPQSRLSRSSPPLRNRTEQPLGNNPSAGQLPGKICGDGSASHVAAGRQAE